MGFTTKLLDILSINATAAKDYIDKLLETKQNKLTFDDAPKKGSTNPVTSDGIRKAIDTATPNVDFSNYPTKNGTGATGTWPISISGTATKASQDSNGKVITDTYLKKAGDTATGDITAPNFIGHLKGNADTATKARLDAEGNDIVDTYVPHYVNIGNMDLDSIRIGGLYAAPLDANATAERHYPEVSHAGSILVMNNGANGENGCTQVYTTFDTHNSYKREYDAETQTWSAWRKYAFEDSTVAKAQKLATARKINITGNATGAANFDGSSDVSISVTVNESKHAATATKALNIPTSDVGGNIWIS